MRTRMQGLTLVEMMVAMVLGLVVVGGAISLTLANRQSYRTNEGLSQVQESARTAFELLARDLRQAGVTGCDNSGRIANVLDTSGGTEWWMDWFGILGHEDDSDTSAVAFGANRGDRVAGTDALQLQGLQGIPFSVDDHDGGAAVFRLDAATTNLQAGDVLIACDFDHATIFEATATAAGGSEVVHAFGTGANCSAGLGFPTECTASGNAWEFPRSSLLGRFFATDWYIGQSGRDEEGGRSLFRRRIAPGGNLVTEEVVAGVTDMQLTFRRDGETDFVAAETLTALQWPDVNAVMVVMAVESADARVSTDGAVNEGRIRRELSQLIALRNRVP